MGTSQILLNSVPKPSETACKFVFEIEKKKSFNETRDLAQSAFLTKPLPQ